MWPPARRGHRGLRPGGNVEFGLRLLRAIRSTLRPVTPWSIDLRAGSGPRKSQGPEDGFDFAVLFTLWESRRISDPLLLGNRGSRPQLHLRRFDCEAFRLVYRWGLYYFVLCLLFR